MLALKEPLLQPAPWVAVLPAAVSVTECRVARIKPADLSLQVSIPWVPRAVLV